MHSNFEFVRTYHPALHEQLLGAERFLDDDPCCFSLKLRLALELWCRDFADLFGVVLAADSSLSDMLQRLMAEKQFPELYTARLQELRLLCNQAVHAQTDLRGRSVTQAPLGHQLQCTALSYLFDLVCFNLRYSQPDSAIPKWQEYPRRNPRLLLQEAFSGNADACANLSHQLLQQAHRQADAQFWFEKAWRGCSKAVLQLLLDGQSDTSHTSSAEQNPATRNLATTRNKAARLKSWQLSATEQKQLVEHYWAAKPSGDVLTLLARLCTRWQLTDKAARCYQYAAQAGDFGAFDDLLSQSTKDRAALIDLGVKKHHPLSVQLKVLPLLEQLADSTPADSRESPEAAQTQPTAAATQLKPALKQLLNEAKALQVPALSYLQALQMCITQPPTTAAQWQPVARLFEQGMAHVGASHRPACRLFAAAMAAEMWSLAATHAHRALQQQAQYGNSRDTAQLQVDVAQLLIRCSNEQVEWSSALKQLPSPKRLLQQAAQAGHAYAQQLCLQIKHADATARVRVAVPGLLQQLLQRAASTTANSEAPVTSDAPVTSEARIDSEALINSNAAKSNKAVALKKSAKRAALKPATLRLSATEKPAATTNTVSGKASVPLYSARTRRSATPVASNRHAA